MDIITVLTILFIVTNIKYKTLAQIDPKNSLPFFRRQVEEITENTTQDSTTNLKTTNLVLFLVNNVKKIFSEQEDIYQNNENIETIATVTPVNKPEIIDIVTKATTINETTPEQQLKVTNTSIAKRFANITMKENVTVSPLLDEKFNESYKISTEILYGVTEKPEILYLSKDLIFLSNEKSNGIRNNSSQLLINSYLISSSPAAENLESSRRSCIMCNNVISNDCNNPKNKLIPSVVCENDDDLCYSVHTPFGLIDRGCFNVNRNLSTYVCSCNLCNYISISEMPYIFSNKQDWLDNIIELSYTRNYRKSIFGDMSCLTCEINATTNKEDLLDSTNCLEGNIGSTPTKRCGRGEICGVRAVRSDGYIWRGCIKAPLYNYWWALCDNDLCNYDEYISIFSI